VVVALLTCVEHVWPLGWMGIQRPLALLWLDACSLASLQHLQFGRGRC
jgi:hypothetical protein